MPLHNPQHTEEAASVSDSLAIRTGLHQGVQDTLRKLPTEPSTGMHLWHDINKRQVKANFYGNGFSSYFSDIRRVEDGERIAVLASDSKSPDDSGQPWTDLALRLDDEQLTASDRLLRMLHTLNHFMRNGSEAAPLLAVDVHTRFLCAVASNHGWAFRRVLEAIGLSSQQFIIRLSAQSAADLPTLGYVCDNYRRNGFLTSIFAEDFVEAGSLIGQIRPDYLFIRLNASWTASTLPGLVTAAQRYRVKIVATGVSDEHHTAVVAKAGIPLFSAN